nr:hypothetical protein CFP56_47601 [Quercus suber]
MKIDLQPMVTNCTFSKETETLSFEASPQVDKDMEEHHQSSFTNPPPLCSSPYLDSYLNPTSLHTSKQLHSPNFGHGEPSRNQQVTSNPTTLVCALRIRVFQPKHPKQLGTPIPQPSKASREPPALMDIGLPK